MHIRHLAALTVVGLVFAPCSADMGRIYVETQGVSVSETAQKAIILHNDRKEVLILGTEMQATRRTPIVRFIPFPAEPRAALAPMGAFARLSAIVAKYDLKYVTAWQSKGGPAKITSSGVDVRLSARLGQHDLTVIKVDDVGRFREWVNAYFTRKGLPHKSSYAAEEKIVADYVARGIRYFALDAVELGEKRFVDPIMYQFESTSLYYPLKTSNTFGGKGDIELYVFAPQTLCAPGSGMFGETDKAVDAKGHLLGNCFDLPVKASTSVELVPQERDLDAIYPHADAFFGGRPVFVQAIHYGGVYRFDNDVIVPMPSGTARALSGPRAEAGGNPFEHLLPQEHVQGKVKPDPGVCKAALPRFYFDSKSGLCKSFLWGGCGGNVPFETMEECQKVCTAPKL